MPCLWFLLNCWPLVAGEPPFQKIAVLTIQNALCMPSSRHQLDAHSMLLTMLSSEALWPAEDIVPPPGGIFSTRRYLGNRGKATYMVQLSKGHSAVRGAMPSPPIMTAEVMTRVRRGPLICWFKESASQGLACRNERLDERSTCVYAAYDSDGRCQIEGPHFSPSSMILDGVMD